MRNLIVLILLIATVTVQAQVAQYLVICDNSQVEVISLAEQANYPNAVVLKDKLPSRTAANGWISSNQSLIACGTPKATPATPAVVTPPPANNGGNGVQDPPPPPEQKVTHIYPNKFAFFGTVLFPTGNWGDWLAPNTDFVRFVPFMAGFNFRKGNKAKFGFEMAFHGLQKFEPYGDERKMLANATAAFLFSYPVALDKEGRFWFVPEAGLGVDFFDVMQLIDKDDKLIAGPYFLVRVGVEMYHLMPFFYYGQSFMDVSKGDASMPLRPSHIGVGLAIP
ncbi:MAG: hypothetical protein GY751_03585, partial [Bacteroidetes bacterium]|nr:hypothetical protein [Bacteroidota bacterium]